MTGRSDGLEKARAKMLAAGVDPVAVDTFAHYYRLLEHGETGMIPESTIDPVDIESLADADVPADVAADAIGKTVAIKLNGGLGTSMGMERAKSLLCVRRGLSFLDIMARQALHLRKEYDARLPLILMNSFRTSADTLHALGRYDDLAVDGLPIEFLQNKEPKLLASDLTPVSWPKEPDLEWCPPGHGDVYTALRGTGLLDQLIEHGYRYVFVSNSDNLGAVPDPKVAGWFAASGAPFAIEAVRRTPSDRKGGHFARRKTDGRIVLRETAQTAKEDLEALADLNRHQFCSTNNLWFDLHAMKAKLDEREGILGLPLIRNDKTVDPADPDSPAVVQIETAMGAAIEVFDGARLIEVGRDRFIPVKTTNDLLVLRSDVYEIGADFGLTQIATEVPFVELDADHYKLVAEFDQRFPEGAPSLAKASSLTVDGDWTFGHGVQVVGSVELSGKGAQRVPAGEVLTGSDD
ncbi:MULTISPECIES: UTP--glucose-1-phosphate uridylyltransferase [unclassified Nocardioides]|uniref:UTP--glucose-1-phosphate uridylyltransferase n=1 Tax=unclassified Nocardioides TaxID=2615069 RepID=UPI0006F345EA|nr:MULTISPECIES: UTP--glucose-1-phosphate uridylyltransferase [unclassified Nocardioides]KRA31059.1 UTP--glucose-1-phosphate uridylyltransferase [Nocardioides sp. Root614]KRA87679.1 UTP--glucose-1-phosphate uridylyltransferase [Nocardioides sp. Root682]